MCKVEGCDTKLYCGGYCSKHYNRLRTTGTTDDGPKARASAEDRFWRNVQKSTGCWEYKSVRSDGYGLLGMGGRRGKQVFAHRYSWELHNGPIPSGDGYHGMVIMHKCDNPSCVNPDHLQLGTQADNVRDMDAKGRRINDQCRGSGHGMSRFTEDQVREIRASSLNNAELGRIHGVPRQTIRYIRTTGWKHVTSN